MANRQYKVQLSDETIQRLEENATKFNLRSGNSVAAEVINDYLNLWEEAETERQKVVARQHSSKKKKPPKK